MSSMITLNDRKIIKPASLKLPGLLSEYSFANLFLFRKLHDYIFDGQFIYGKTYQGKSFVMPLSFPLEPEIGKVYFPIDESVAQKFEKPSFELTNFARDEDYIFEKKAMINLSGRKLASRRNLLYRFEEDYEPEIRPFDKEASLEVLNHWDSFREGKRDKASCQEAIELMEVLGLEGITLFSGSKPIGFVISENYRPNASLFHFAKALPAIKGVTPFLYRSMAARLPERIKWINLEQDLGLPGLRRAKNAYQPTQKLKKYFLECKE